MNGYTDPDAYGVLGVDPDCDDTEISHAYRLLARRLHPDRAGDTATARMSRINAAFNLIKTPERRAAYDLQLIAEGRMRPGRPTATTRAQPSASSLESAWTTRTSRADERDGTGGAGPPPGRPSGSVLRFGRHVGWSIGEIARVDPGYLVWLSDRREGQPYAGEIDQTLRRVGFR